MHPGSAGAVRGADGLHSSSWMPARVCLLRHEHTIQYSYFGTRWWSVGGGGQLVATRWAVHGELAKMASQLMHGRQRVEMAPGWPAAGPNAGHEAPTTAQGSRGLLPACRHCRHLTITRSSKPCFSGRRRKVNWPWPGRVTAGRLRCAPGVPCMAACVRVVGGLRGGHTGQDVGHDGSEDAAEGDTAHERLLGVGVDQHQQQDVLHQPPSQPASSQSVTRLVCQSTSQSISQPVSLRVCELVRSVRGWVSHAVNDRVLSQSTSGGAIMRSHALSRRCRYHMAGMGIRPGSDGWRRWWWWWRQARSCSSTVVGKTVAQQGSRRFVPS
jgi:hypothetical protein